MQEIFHLLSSSFTYKLKIVEELVIGYLYTNRIVLFQSHKNKTIPVKKFKLYGF